MAVVPILDTTQHHHLVQILAAIQLGLSDEGAMALGAACPRHRVVGYRYPETLLAHIGS